MFEDLEGTRVQAVGERVIDQIGRHGEEVYVLLVLDPIPLQGAEVVAVAEFGEQLLEDSPVAVPALRPELVFEMALQIRLDAIVVEQCIVDINEEDDTVRG